MQSDRKTAPCPHCTAALERVKQGSNSMLNAEQFDAVRAGDWFCRSCPEPGKRYRYFWDKDLGASYEAARPKSSGPDVQKTAPVPVSPDTEHEKPIEAWTWFDDDMEPHLSRDEPPEGMSVHKLTPLVAKGGA